ncbi:MAG: zinc ABC transporter substrate-binding protein, partial [Mobilitalea sp.]
MKKKLLLLLGAMAIIAMIGAVIISIADKKTTSNELAGEDKLQIVTTIYPVYMIGLNIAGETDKIEVKSLTKLNTGCLHDYQLTTEDMKIIASADILVINGGGMEGFLDDIQINYPELTVIDASEGITMLPNTSEGYEFETHEGEEEHDENNAHVWLNPKLYISQIETVREGILNFIKAN